MFTSKTIPQPSYPYDFHELVISDLDTLISIHLGIIYPTHNKTYTHISTKDKNNIRYSVLDNSMVISMEYTEVQFRTICNNHLLPQLKSKERYLLAALKFKGTGQGIVDYSTHTTMIDIYRMLMY